MQIESFLANTGMTGMLLPIGNTVFSIGTRLFTGLIGAVLLIATASATMMAGPLK